MEVPGPAAAAPSLFSSTGDEAGPEDAPCINATFKERIAVAWTAARAEAQA